MIGQCHVLNVMVLSDEGEKGINMCRDMTYRPNVYVIDVCDTVLLSV